MKKTLVSIAGYLVFTIALGALFVAPAHATSTKFSNTKVSTANTYIVQFLATQANFKSILSREASAFNTEQIFQLNSDPRFTNTFRFASELSLSDMQQNLAGQYVYLDIENQFQTDLNSSAKSDSYKLPNDPGFTKNGANIDKQWGLIKSNFPKK